MIGIDMKMPDSCWGCKFKYGRCETKCFFTHKCVDDAWYSKRKSSDCPLKEIPELKGGAENES